MYVCIYAWLTFDCLQQVSLSCSTQHEVEIRDSRIKRARCLHFESLRKDGFPTEALRLCHPLSPFCLLLCACVCVSGGKSMVLVLLSVSSVSLVSYHQPPCSFYSTCTVTQPPGTVHEPHSSTPGKTELEDTASNVQNGPCAISEGAATMSKFETWSQTSD